MAQHLLNLSSPPPLTTAPLNCSSLRFGTATPNQHVHHSWASLHRSLNCNPRFTCLFSHNNRKQEQAKKALESALGGKKTEFEKWDKEIQKRTEAGGGGDAGGGGWFRWGRWFGGSNGDNFWQEAQQTSLAVLGIILMLHSKKRNRLEQQRLNDLVYVKYNRTLRFRYDMRNTLDPISLQNIDESNEWLLGRMDGESDEDNEPVFDDDDGLTWATVARASGVEESSHASRATSSRSKAQPRISKPSTLTPLQLIDEEEAGSDDTEEEDVEGYKSTDGEEDDSLLAIDVEDDD